MADALDSKSSVRKDVWVQVPPPVLGLGRGTGPYVRAGLLAVPEKDCRMKALKRTHVTRADGRGNVKPRGGKRTPFPSGVSKPALRALAGAGFEHLEQLATVPEADLLKLHGMGPNALEKLRSALADLGLSVAGKKPAENEIDRYISRFPADVQAILQEVRETIRRAAPDAEEVISYQMPAFRQHGILVYFAAWKEHIGLYPPISGDKSIEKAVARYAGPKGNLQFPLDEPMPLKLIERIVKLRVTQNNTKVEARRKKKSSTARKPRASN